LVDFQKDEEGIREQNNSKERQNDSQQSQENP
jgi:hypothetical protein